MRYWEELLIFGPDTASNPDFTTKAHKVKNSFGSTPRTLAQVDMESKYMKIPRGMGSKTSPQQVQDFFPTK